MTNLLNINVLLCSKKTSSHLRAMKILLVGAIRWLIVLGLMKLLYPETPWSYECPLHSILCVYPAMDKYRNIRAHCLVLKWGNSDHSGINWDSAFSSARSWSRSFIFTVLFTLEAPKLQRIMTVRKAFNPHWH